MNWLALQTAHLTPPVMSNSGWIFMGLAWLFVIGLAIWCFKRVLGGNPNG